MTTTYAHLCPDGTIYKWKPIKSEPKACPRDKERIDAPHIIRKKIGQITFFYSPRRMEKFKNSPEFKKQFQELNSAEMDFFGLPREKKGEG